MSITRKIVRAALVLVLTGFIVVPGGHATSPRLTAAECVQADEVARNVYEQARANPHLYPTDEAAKGAAQRAYARRVGGELGDPNIGYVEAVEWCRRTKAPHISRLIGLLGATAVKGVRGPTTNR